MGLGQALSAAVSGLRVTQSNLALVASNIANAETPGYVKKSASQVANTSGDVTIGVRLSSINRELDQYLQRQLRTETAGGAYASTRADFFQRLQGILGQPGESNALETVFNDFVTALQSLSTSPDSGTTRYGVLTAAQTLAQHLNGMTADIQGMRGDAELALSDAVNQANSALRNIAAINRQLGLTNVQDATTATLQDQRDYYLDQLSQLMDIKVVQTDHNQVQVFTRAGTQLVGDRSASIIFDAKGSLSAASQWDADPSKRSVGTLLIDTGAGTPVDMISGGMIGSGKIAALLEMRDHILTDAQAQLDQIAAAMSSALSDRTTAGTAASFGSQSGFDLDIGSLLSGNKITVTYTDTLTNTQRTLTLVRVDDPRVLPLSNSATAGTGDKVIGIDFSGGIGSALAQLSSALGPAGLHVSNPSGTTLRVLDSGAGGKVALNALTATTTTTSLINGGSELPFFLDGTKPYSGAIGALGSQSHGLCGPHRVERSASRRSIAAGHHADLAADLGRRLDTAELSSRSPHAWRARLRAGSRNRDQRGAVYRLAAVLHPPDDQPAGRGSSQCRQPQSGSAGRRQYAAAALRRQVECQHRPGNGQPDEAADRIRRECARPVGGKGHAGRAVPGGVRRR